MKLTPKIQKAINVASTLHFGQSRKDSGDLPYISHPFAVAWILAEYTDDENIVVAGLLHDVIEDVQGYGYDEIVADFGKKVADTVKGVSEVKISGDRGASWEERKKEYLELLKHDNEASLMVSAADKIHNLRSLVDAYKVQGESLWENFHSPKDKKLWFYEEVYKIIKERLDDGGIVKELGVALKTARKELKISK